MRRSLGGARRLLTSDGPGGSVIRGLLPAAVALLMVLGFLSWQGLQQGLYGSRFGLRLLTLAAIAVIGALLLYFAHRLDRNEMARRETEDELRRSSRYFELSRDLVCTLGFDGYFKQLNAAWTKTLGWSESELRARPCAEFVHPDDRRVTEREHTRLASGGLTVGFVNRYATKDGGWRWIDWRAMAIVEDRLIYGSARDVTQRNEAEAALEASERQTRQILQTAHDAFISIDERGLITDWNPQAQASFGWSRDEVLGHELASVIIPESHRDAHRRGIERFVATGRAHVLGKRLELTAIHRDGHEFPVELTISALQTDGGYAFHAFLRDITERRQVERAKDEFVSIVSHELRTPLTSIRGSLGLLAGGVLGRRARKAERMLQIALENTDRLVRLINDILDIERIDSDKVDMHEQRCDAAELIERAIQGVAQIAADAQVRLTAEAAPVALLADPDMVLQTLTNLISNAVKFSPPGSTVRISSQGRGEEVLFEVADRGRGIPSENLESIFERFAQVDASDSREKGGTGLGLAICRKIVELHGGRIWVRSELGIGSTFSFVLPAPVTEGDPVRAGAPDRAIGSRDDAFRVLIVEDDPSLAEVLIAIFDRHGVECIATNDGREAIELCLRMLPDLLVLDIGLPEVDGFEVVDRLHRDERLNAMPIVVYTARDIEDADRERLTLGSITEFLTKGHVTPAEFERRVMKLLVPPHTTFDSEACREPEAHPAG